MKDNIRAILVYIAANFRISSRIAENVRIFEISNMNHIIIPLLT